MLVRVLVRFPRRRLASLHLLSHTVDVLEQHLRVLPLGFVFILTQQMCEVKNERLNTVKHSVYRFCGFRTFSLVSDPPTHPPLFSSRMQCNQNVHNPKRISRLTPPPPPCSSQSVDCPNPGENDPMSKPLVQNASFVWCSGNQHSSVLQAPR